MKSDFNALIEKTNLNSKEYKPMFYRLMNAKDLLDFSNLLDTNPAIHLHDEIQGQVEELVKTLNPKIVYGKEKLTEEATKHFGSTPKEKYGVWVYYKWSNKLVHILDEAEFVFVRTSRNKYKITPEEELILKGKKIGVIGLSVGQSVAVTLAMERGCGELRLADFDILELTNLNRIRTGIHNLGIAKVYSVAREISEIDPYIKVVCYPDGLTEKNMNDFFTSGGKLDLLIEESDGFDIKILSRYKARELQIPVLMEASDKCMIDVERFDLEPQRSILHGLVDHLDITTLKSLKTNEEKIPYMLDLLGINTASTRLLASMFEIEQSINTWPQLASAVTMGGGITADISRRVLLNKYTESGRYHIDIEELVGNKINTESSESKGVDFDYPELTVEQMSSIVSNIKSNTSSIISESNLIQIVEAGIMAPSAGNNQPWKFLSKNNKLYLFHDKKQSVSWSDYKNLISYISLGTVIENISIKSNGLGYNINLKLFPLENNESLIAEFSFEEAALVKSNLESYIFQRSTNRKKGNGELINESVLKDIKETSEVIENVKLHFVTNKAEIEQISKIVSIAERIRFLNPQGHHDFYSKELKWPNKNGDKIAEGLDIKTLELKLSEEIGLRVASNPKIINLLNEWKVGTGFEKISYSTINSSSAIGLISMSEFSEINWLNGGRAAQRAWLCAAKHQLALQPISAPLFLNLQMLIGGESNFNPSEREQLEKIYSNLKTIFSNLTSDKGVFLFRLSHAGEPSTRSLRKDINDLFYKAV